MAMEIEIISRESVKPASPTLLPLNLCKVSPSNQTSLYLPITLFYPTKKRASQENFGIEKSQLVKQSLAQTLTRIFQLEGKIREKNYSVEFEDGVHYVEARVKCHLSKFLKRPNYSMIQKFLPSVTSLGGVQPMAMIQVNFFNCGGIAIGALFSHLIIGQIDIGTFLKDWAATARESCNKEGYPGFITDYSVPYQDSFRQKELNIRATSSTFLSKERAITRRVVFDSEAIASLKTITTSSRVPNPTTVEVISALIWKCIMAALREKSGLSKPCLFTLSTKLRKTAAALSKDGYNSELDALVHELRQAITKTSGYFSEKLQDDIDEDVMSGNGIDYIGCSSWCNNGLYEVEFGWGRPAWVTTVGYSKLEPLFVNNVVLIETRWGDGVEAWVTLDEQEMSVLETNKELLTFASVNSSPLHFGV